MYVSLAANHAPTPASWWSFYPSSAKPTPPRYLDSAVTYLPECGATQSPIIIAPIRSAMLYTVPVPSERKERLSAQRRVTMSSMLCCCEAGSIGKQRRARGNVCCNHVCRPTTSTCTCWHSSFFFRSNLVHLSLARAPA